VVVDVPFPDNHIICGQPQRQFVAMASFDDFDRFGPHTISLRPVHVAYS
jgi:hypothetical protein